MLTPSSIFLRLTYNIYLINKHLQVPFTIVIIQIIIVIIVIDFPSHLPKMEMNKLTISESVSTANDIGTLPPTISTSMGAQFRGRQVDQASPGSGSFFLP